MFLLRQVQKGVNLGILYVPKMSTLHGCFWLHQKYVKQKKKKLKIKWNSSQMECSQPEHNVTMPLAVPFDFN